MVGREVSREELFAMVWEQPTQEVAKELGVSDVAIGKLHAPTGSKAPTRLLGQGAVRTDTEAPAARGIP